MLSHHLRLALRIFRGAPFTTVVNLLTLAAGLFCFLTAYAFFAFWNGAEHYFPNADRTYVLTTTARAPDGTFALREDPMGPSAAAAQLRLDFPRLERVARATLVNRETIVSVEGRAARLFTAAVDPDFLEIFALPFVSGDPRHALDRPRSAVLTKEAARRLFGDEAPVGQNLRIDNRVDITVTGLTDAVPEPSHFGRSTSALLPFDALLSRDVVDSLAAKPPAEQGDWFSSNSLTYMLLPSDGSLTAATLKTELEGFAKRHIPAVVLKQSGVDVEFGLVPVTKLLAKGIDESLFPGVTGLSVSAVLLVLGSLVLAAACLNYASLATAGAVRRVREAGLRKVLGASPGRVMAQHLLESAVLSVLALAVAVVAFRVATPLLEVLIGADVWRTLFGGAGVWIVMLLVVAGVAVASAAYPAFVIARVLPMEALRGSGAGLAPKRLPMLLAGTQFTVASFLFIAAAVTGLQNAELERTGLASTTDPLLVLENRDGANRVDPQTLRAELLRIPQVLGVTDVDAEPWLDFGVMDMSAAPDGTSPTRWVMPRSVGRDFFAVFTVETLAGRALSPNRAEDEPVSGQLPTPERPLSAVVDRAFIEQFGFGSPEADNCDVAQRLREARHHREPVRVAFRLPSGSSLPRPVHLSDPADAAAVRALPRHHARDRRRGRRGPDAAYSKGQAGGRIAGRVSAVGT